MNKQPFFQGFPELFLVFKPPRFFVRPTRTPLWELEVSRPASSFGRQVWWVFWVVERWIYYKPLSKEVLTSEDKVFGSDKGMVFLPQGDIWCSRLFERIWNDFGRKFDANGKMFPQNISKYSSLKVPTKYSYSLNGGCLMVIFIPWDRSSVENHQLLTNPRIVILPGFFQQLFNPRVMEVDGSNDFFLFNWGWFLGQPGVKLQGFVLGESSQLVCE